MAKIVRYRAIPDPDVATREDYTAIRYIPVHAAEASNWTGWRGRSRAERGTNPVIQPPLRAKLAPKTPTIAVYRDSDQFRACESRAAVDPVTLQRNGGTIREKRPPSGVIWTSRQQRMPLHMAGDKLAYGWRNAGAERLDPAEFDAPFFEKGRYLGKVSQKQSPVGEKLCADGLIRPTDQNGVVRY